jgi:hypothetical protein
MNTVPLSSIANITSGLSIPEAIRHVPGGRFQILSPRHVDDGGRPFIYDDQVHAMRMDFDERLAKRAEAYCVTPGDVVFMSRGEKNRAAVIRSCPTDTVAPVAFFIIRPTNSTVLADYLAWYLNQVPAQAFITQHRTGAGTPLVQRQSFGELPVSLPTLAKQQSIAHLGELMLRELSLVERLGTSVAARNRILVQTILNTISPTEH